MRFVLFFSILMSLPSVAHADCDVTDFMDRSLGDLSVIQQLAYLSVASDESMQSQTDSFDGSGWYGAIGGEASFDRVRANATKKFNSLKFEHASDYRTSWNESSLSESGLAGYRDCLKSKVGLHYTVSSLSEESSIITVDWVPGTIGDLKDAPIIIGSFNILNLGDIKSSLGKKPWGRTAKSVEILIQRKEAGEASSVSIQIGNETRVIYLPPPEVQLQCPASGEFSTSIYNENLINIPLEMYGCDVKVTAIHTARGRAGWVKVDAEFRNLNGQRSVICSTPKLNQSANMLAECSSVIRVPLFADFIWSKSENNGTDTVSDSLKVTYNSGG